VTIDSPHQGGRQIYLIDISGIMGYLPVGETREF
jgi:hypothetical protein